MPDAAELEKLLQEYAVELGGATEEILHPKNKYKKLLVFRTAGEDIEPKIFLIIHKDSEPLVIDFLAHPEIQKKLVEEYETASRSNLLDKKRAVQLVLTGQFSLEDVKSFIWQSKETVI
ncbi:MAG: MmcQ/YjbR family DNA-binding protein [Candidatus Nomurabacteria bacterium]|jgi:predicted DNA-binding protein (MmcQ/YjbR family)|nr:MmcQ/YjbR family DNA-binding protein [Candidatus Nomurabacteria bacterium]